MSQLLLELSLREIYLVGELPKRSRVERSEDYWFYCRITNPPQLHLNKNAVPDRAPPER